MNWVVAILHLPPEASTFAPGLDALHAVIFGTAVVGSALVLTLAVIFIARFHVSRTNVKRRKHTGHANTAWEAFVISFLLSLFLLWWAIGFHQYDNMVNPPRDSLIVYVTAKQWMWKFEHSTGEIELSSLTVPEGVPVELVMTSRDVIHSFFVPAFRIKQDVLPGRYTTAWFNATMAGDFPLRCAEMCGTGHSEMLAMVHVVPAQRYEDALSPLRPTALGARRGLAVAAKYGCLSCHSLDGSPRVGPTWQGLYGSDELMSDGASVRADEAYLTQSMMEPGAKVVLGYANLMPTFAGVLQPADTGAIVELIKSIGAGAPAGGYSLGGTP